MLEKLIYTSTTTDTSEGLVAQLANYLADSVYYTRDWSGHWLFYDKNDTAACFPKQITALSCFRVIWISEYCFWKISLVLTIVQFVESWFTFSKYFSSLVFGQWKKLGKIYKQINYRTSNVPLRYFYFFFFSKCISQFKTLSNWGNQKISAERAAVFLQSHADKSNEKMETRHRQVDPKWNYNSAIIEWFRIHSFDVSRF